MLFIDTNVYKEIGKATPQVLDLLADSQHIAMPFIVVAELLFGYELGVRGDEDRQLLDRFLASPRVTVIYSTAQTASFYATIAASARKAGRALQQNDILIAALALENEGELATYDKDFAGIRQLFAKGQLRILTHVT